MAKAMRRLDPDLRSRFNAIQGLVCVEFDITHRDLISHDRKRVFILPRHIAMWLCRHITGLSLTIIAMSFGGRDHTTIIHGIRKVNDLLERDNETANRCRAMVRKWESIYER